MKYLSAICQGLLILGFSSGLGIALVYCQQQFKWNSECLQLALLAVGITVSLWAYFFYTQAIKEFHQSLDDWD